jgi:hypothetical protein
MADFFKGLAGGMQTGLQFGRAMQERQERERLREAMGLTPQEIAPRPPTQEELGRAIAETEKRAADDARMFATENSLENRTGLFSSNPAERPLDASFAPQMPYVGQKVGGTQYRLGDQTLNRMPTQQEIEAARYAAAANVLAERDPVAAARMRQEQVRMQRENELFPLQKQQLETQVESGKIGLKKSGFELTAAERADADAQKMTDFNAWRSQNPQADFASTTAKAQELGISIDQQFKIASNMTGIKEQAFKASQQRIEDIIRENPSLDGLLKAHKESKDLDPNSHFEVIRGQGGKVSLNRVNTATGEIIQPNVFSGSEAETTAYLNKAAMNPATVIDYTMNLEKNKAAIEKDRAATEASRSNVSYNAARTSQINQMNNALATNLKNSEEAKQIQTQFALLDDTNDPGGAKRQSLITQFNMLSVKAGGTIPTTGVGKKGSVLQTPVELKKNDDGTYTAFSKDGGRALYNTYNGEEIPLGMTVDAYTNMKAAAQKNSVGLVTGEENGRLVLKFVGPDGKFYDDAEKAKYAKPAKADTQSGGLDTSRTPVVQPAAEPTAPTPKPEKRSGETQPEFRARLLAWDRNRIAYERLMTEQRLRGQLSGNAAGLRRPLVD